MKNRRIFGLFRQLLKPLLTALVLCCTISVNASFATTTFVFTCLDGTSTSRTSDTDNTIVLPTVASRCGTTQQSHTWTCKYTVIPRSTPIPTNGGIYPEGTSVRSVSASATITCVPVLLVNDVEDGDMFVEGRWVDNVHYITKAHKSSLNGVVTYTPQSTVEVDTWQYAIVSITDDPDNGRYYGDRFWIYNPHKSLASRIKPNNGYSKIITGTNTLPFNAFYAQTADVNVVFGYEVKFYCPGEYDPTEDPTARIVLDGNGSTGRRIPSDVVTQVRSLCNVTSTNSEMYCKRPNSSTWVQYYDNEHSSPKFTKGAECVLIPKCSEGTYLPANSPTCIPCPTTDANGQGYYCPGGDFEPSSSDQGKYNCPQPYKLSVEGNTNENFCYAWIPFYDIALATFDGITYGNVSYQNKAQYKRATTTLFEYISSSGAHRLKSQYLKNGASAPTKTGYTFEGWTWQTQDVTASECSNAGMTFLTSKRGCSLGGLSACPSGWSYYGGLCIPNSKLIDVTSSTDLSITGDQKNIYAKWTPNVYTITYNTNGGWCNGGDSTTHNCQPVTYTTESPNISLPTPSKTGYIFNGWCENSGLTINCDPNKTINHGSIGNKTFWAKWTPITYTIKFDPNGASGTKDDIACTYDQPCNITNTSADFTYIGYNWLSWNTAADGSGTTYGTTVTNLSSTNGAIIQLYAIWESNTSSCGPHEYYNGSTQTCVSCTAGNYCPGTTYTNGSTDDAGLNSCADLDDPSYTQSQPNSDSPTDCYKFETTTCAVANPSSADNATITYSNMGNVQCYKFYGSNTCILKNASDCQMNVQCNIGYSLVNGTDELKDLDPSYNSSISYYRGLASNSEHNFPPQQINFYNKGGIWAAAMNDTGDYFRGEARCTATKGVDSSYSPMNEIIDNYGNASYSAFCWCRITQHGNSFSNMTDVSSPWAFVPMSSYATAKCERICAQECATNAFGQDAAFRQVLFSNPKYCEPNTINLDWQNGGHGTLPANLPPSCIYGQTFTIPSDIMTATGFTFKAWTVNGHEFAAGETVECSVENLGVSDDEDLATITGAWDNTVYRFDLNKNASDATGGTDAIYEKFNTDWYLDANATTAINSNNPITAPTRTGYTFGGYYRCPTTTGLTGCEQIITETGVTPSSVLTNLTSGETLYAKWTADAYQIHYERDGGTCSGDNTPECGPSTYTITNTVALTDPTKQHNEFAGWCRYSTEPQTEATICTTGCANPTDTNCHVAPGAASAIPAGSIGERWFYAQFNSFDVYYKCFENDATNQHTLSPAPYNDTFTMPADDYGCEKTGHHFVGWECKYLDENNTPLTNGATYNQPYSATCVAQWEANDIYLAWDKNTGGSDDNMTIDSGEYKNNTCTYGASTTDAGHIVVPQPTRPGYIFNGWDIAP